MSSSIISQAGVGPSLQVSLPSTLLRSPAFWAVVITFLAFGLRVWALERVPPGWRDDELIETLVISQKILDGDLAFYYPDASGHEALYHVLNALFLAWFGPTGPGIRLLSAFLGTLTVPVTYILARRMLEPDTKFTATAPVTTAPVTTAPVTTAPVTTAPAITGLIAAALLAVSFWGLMYARVGIRHSLTPLLATLAFYFFWRAMTIGPGDQRSFRFFLAAGTFLGLGFHSYFASRGAPLIPLAFLVYMAIVEPEGIRQKWRGIAVMFFTTVLVALPLLLAVAAQPEAEGRVGELALPVIEARQGNYDVIIDHAVAALAMPHSGGDPEWLYNIPERPVFGSLGAVFFWIGVGISIVWALTPLLGRVFRQNPRVPAEGRSLAAAFLLIWWLVGISPAVLSVPPASLGHVILAQPAFYVLAAVPVSLLAIGLRRTFGLIRIGLILAATFSLISLTAARDLTAYFHDWPQRGMVRFLYRADIEAVANFVLRDPEAPAPTDFGITGLLAGPWDRVALDLALGGRSDVRPRWFNPERALLLWPDISFSGYPAVESPYAGVFTPLPEDSLLQGGYQLTHVVSPVMPALENGEVFQPEIPVCFANHLCWTAANYEDATGWLELQWQVDDRLALPPLPLISNPPPPGVYAGPRLFVFAHLVDGDRTILAGDDGLWVDPLTLEVGDVFLQRHLITSPPGTRPAAVQFGLYDPMTGERILTNDGRDLIHLPLFTE
jgi:4-amino-4-deoxy-L-arabinose transferase-like glycosyltransferase